MLPLVCSAADKPVKYKTLLSEAKAAIKNSRNQANAEKNLLAAVKREDITSVQRAEIYYMSEELERSQQAAENMKFYLKQSYDTTKFFSTILKMHEHLLACDSVESQPDAKGVVKYKYRNKSREILKKYRPNLLNGGKFLLKKNKNAEAFPYFDMYMETSKSPIFESYSPVKDDTLLLSVAYWATVSAYNSNQPAKALKYIDEAISGADPAVRVLLQEYKVRCYESIGDEDSRIENLVVGTKLYPAHDYFFLHLMDVYAEQKSYTEGLNLCDTLLSKVGDKSIYWLGKSRMYMGMMEYDSCIVTADNALRYDSLMADAYYNKGVAYLNKAVAFAATACNDVRDPKCRQDRQTLQKLYREAQKPMEEMRKLQPEASHRWGSPLYRIYLNLNMGKEFAEIEKILNSQ